MSRHAPATITDAMRVRAAEVLGPGHMLKSTSTLFDEEETLTVRCSRCGGEPMHMAGPALVDAGQLSELAVRRFSTFRKKHERCGLPTTDRRGTRGAQQVVPGLDTRRS